MQPSPFNDLSLPLKSYIIREFGSPLLSIEYYDHRIELFALNTIFVERYQNIETGRIEKISEATYHDLDKYLSRIIIGSVKAQL